MSNNQSGEHTKMVCVPFELAEQAAGWLEVHSEVSSIERVLASELREAIDKPAVLRQGEPVAWQVRSKTNRPESQWTPWKDCCEMTRAMHSHEVGRFNQFGIMREMRPVYANADPGEVERLLAENESLPAGWYKDESDNNRYWPEELEEARAQLAKRNALLDRMYYYLSPALASHQYSMSEDTMHDALSALHEWRQMRAGSEPIAPKCDACKGHGVIGWTRGQTAESYEEGESPCEDCNATGYAHSNGMAVSGTCATCSGLGTVPDGEITGLDGVEFANGPVECVKDCPDCGSGPDSLTDLATWKRRAIEAESKLRTYDPKVLELSQQEVASLLAEPRPSEVVLMKCVLCDQLQADLTERDERIDQLRSGYVFETGPYQVELSEDQWSAALGVFENYNMGDDKHLVFLEEQGRGLISEILIEIGVARAPDADEVAE